MALVTHVEQIFFMIFSKNSTFNLSKIYEWVPQTLYFAKIIHCPNAGPKFNMRVALPLNWFWNPKVNYEMAFHTYTLSHLENDQDVSTYSWGRRLSSRVQFVCFLTGSKRNTGIGAWMMRLAACILVSAQWRHGCSRDETKYRYSELKSECLGFQL